MSETSEYTMCPYCYSVMGGHTLACQVINEAPPKQVPIPDDSPWLKRRLAEKEAEKLK
jgi:hypothetical protein